MWTQQLQLTVADLVVEVHDTHHPIAAGQYHQSQRSQAKRREVEFISSPRQKYIGYFAFVGVIILGTGRTTVLQGVISLIIFAAFLSVVL